MPLWASSETGQIRISLLKIFQRIDRSDNDTYLGPGLWWSSNSIQPLLEGSRLPVFTVIVGLNFQGWHRIEGRGIGKGQVEMLQTPLFLL